jgi:2-O-methyltransferase
MKAFLKWVYFHIMGEPLVTRSRISRELIRACVGKENPTILEIGCNDGSDSLWFLECFKCPKIFCFEPDPRAIARFKRKVGQRSSVHLIEMALSDREGELEFYQSGGDSSGGFGECEEGWDYSGSIKKPKNHFKVYPWVSFDRTIRVKTSTLDAWCAENAIGPIDFIWMDVQGAELDVIRGAQKMLAQAKFIYTEYSNRELYESQSSLLELIRSLNLFKILVRYPEDALFCNKKLIEQQHARVLEKHL